MATKKKRTPVSPSDSWVVIAADSVVDAKKRDADSCFVKLKNPRTDTASLYLLGSGDTQLYEVKAFEEDCHSWFIGQTVQQDGRLLFITPLDPLFLLLPYLLHAGKEKFQPVDQLLVDENFPACSRLLSCSCSLHHVADEKEVGSRKFYRYSQERTLDWLKKKVDRTVVALKKKNISVGEGVSSVTYIKVKTESACHEEDYLRYAHGLISEYLSEDLSNALLKHLHLPELTSPKESEPPSKKRKLSDKLVEAEEDYTKFNSADFARKPPKKMTAAQKSLAKVDKSGMKTMSSFFSPKVKAEKK
ncbi:ribonuclease H2 subunit B isoform X2 [Eucyclogobius newberryi]|uniref:ribonuclease H2 subunit B isoform X2 n=1 Tax=Eucyclogobius newberryi TaxID=166745 RepID=UPI003B5C77EC